MLPLSTNTLPSSASELERLLNDSLSRVFTGLINPVVVRDKAYPHLAEIRMALDRARLHDRPPSPPQTAGPGSPALEVDQLLIEGRDLEIGPATASLRLAAREVQLHAGREANANIVLLVHRVAKGELEVSAETAAIEKAIATVARTEAGKHGVTIDQVQLTLRSRGDRRLDAEVQLRAKKLFFTTTVRVGAKLDLDQQLNARLSGLSCSGEGAIGAIACGALQPHLLKLDGRSFPLLALPLGEVRLHDVRIATGTTIQVTAEFGS